MGPLLLAVLAPLSSAPTPTPIAGGDEVANADYEAAVYIRAHLRDCSGVLLSPTIGLTAAHCLDDVRFGQQVNMVHGAAVTGGTVQQVSAWGIHPQYCPSCDDDQHDLSWFETTLPVDSLQSAAVPVVAQEEWDELVRIDQPLIQVGFGQDETGNVTLERTQLSVVIDDILPSGRELQVTPRNGGSCDGDSGGPLWGTLSNGDTRLVSINSRSLGGCPSELATSTTPYYALCWVRDETGLDLLPADDPNCTALDTTQPGCGACTVQTRDSGQSMWMALGLVLLALRRRRT